MHSDGHVPLLVVLGQMDGGNDWFSDRNVERQLQRKKILLHAHSCSLVEGFATCIIIV